MDLIQSSSADRTSSAHISRPLSFLDLLINRRTQAVTRSSFFQLLYRLTSIIWCATIFVTCVLLIKACVVVAGFWIISFQAFSLSDWIWSSCGHSFSSLHRNSGPFHHLFSETNSLADMPRDGISAGFWLPGQNLHESGVVCARISCTLLMTYCFQGLRFLIQHKTVIESIQNTVSNFRGKAF